MWELIGLGSLPLTFPEKSEARTLVKTKKLGRVKGPSQARLSRKKKKKIQFLISGTKEGLVLYFLQTLER